MLWINEEVFNIVVIPNENPVPFGKRNVLTSQ